MEESGLLLTILSPGKLHEMGSPEPLNLRVDRRWMSSVTSSCKRNLGWEFFAGDLLWE